MADIYAEDLEQETSSSLDGSEQFVMFDSTAGKRATLSDVADYIDAHLDAGIKDDVKEALLNCFQHVAWVDEHGQEYYDALEDALYPRELSSINAVFDSQGHIIYDSNTLDDLKQYLTVTANYSDSTSETVTNYTLSGNLTSGTSVITVNYQNKRTTFNVTVVTVELSSITAEFDQGTADIYTDDSLDTLRQYLTVTANYSDDTTREVSNYTLSGNLTAGTSVITAKYQNKTTTFNVLVTQATISSIVASYTQRNPVYTTGSLDSLREDLQVTAIYSDETAQTITDYTLSGSLTVGTSVITVSYQNKTTTFNVTVTAVELSSITASFNSQGHTIYDNYNLEDLKQYLTVIANYNDSSTSVVTDYTLSGNLTAGTSVITVSYQGKTTTFEVTVVAYEVTSISAVFNAQGQTIYTDDTLNDLKPYLSVTAHYSDSTSEIITDYTLSGNLTAGTSVITVSYQGKTTTFNVTVTETPYLYRMRDVPITLDGTTGINTGFQMLSENRSFTLVCEFVDNKQYTVDNVTGYLFGCYEASSPYTGTFMQVYDGGSATIDGVEARKIRHVFRATPRGTNGGQTIFDNIIPTTQIVGRVVRFCFAYNSVSGTVDVALSVDGVAITPSVPTVQYDFTAITAPLMAGSRLGIESQSNFMKGTYNDFKVFNYAFTSGEIEAYIGGEE